MLSTDAQPDNAKEVLVQGETKEKPTYSVLTTLSEVAKATMETAKVNTFGPVQETCEVESQVVNKEIEHGITYKDAHSINYIINCYLLVVKYLHPILSRLPLMEKSQNFFHTASSSS